MFKKNRHGGHSVSSLISQTFFGLAIPPNLIGTQSTVKSIMIGTILALLQQALRTNRVSADSVLTGIINKDHDFVDTICTTMTHVPDFGEQLQNPSHGFQYLCDLNAVAAVCEPTGIMFHPNQELVAADPHTNNPEGLHFQQSFCPMSVKLSNHFNLIFSPKATSSSLGISSPSMTSDSSLSPSDSGSRLSSRNSSPGLVISQPLIQSPLAQSFSSFSSRDSSPHLSALPSPDSFPHENWTPQTVTSDTPNIASLGNNIFQGHNSVDWLLLNFNVTQEQKVAAQYDKGKPLYAMVRNFLAMESILSHLGYSIPFKARSTKMIKIQEVSILAHDVLRHFQWMPHSFEHKGVWYMCAEHAANQIWRKAMPGKILSS